MRFYSLLLFLISIGLMYACVRKEEYLIRNASVRHMHPQIIGYYSFYHAETDSGYLIKYCLDSILTQSKVEKRETGSCDQYLISKKESNKLEFVEVRNIMRGRNDSLFYIADYTKSFVLQNKPYKVYRFELRNPPIDGRQVRFWTPEFGFILWEHPDWLDESSLIALDGYSREDLAQLIQLIKRDTIFFRRGE